MKLQDICWEMGPIFASFKLTEIWPFISSFNLRILFSSHFVSLFQGNYIFISVLSANVTFYLC